MHYIYLDKDSPYIPLFRDALLWFHDTDLKGIDPQELRRFKIKAKRTHRKLSGAYHLTPLEFQTIGTALKSLRLTLGQNPSQDKRLLQLLHELEEAHQYLYQCALNSGFSLG